MTGEMAKRAAYIEVAVDVDCEGLSSIVILLSSTLRSMKFLGGFITLEAQPS